MYQMGHIHSCSLRHKHLQHHQSFTTVDAGDISEEAGQAEDGEKEGCTLCQAVLPDVERGVLRCVSVPTEYVDLPRERVDKFP